MANDNVFAQSPVRAALDNERNRISARARGILPGQSEQPQPAADPKLAIEGIARKSRVPVNVLMSIGEAAGAKSPDEALKVAQSAADRLGPMIQQGMSPRDAITAAFGKDAPPEAVDAIIGRARAIREELYPNALNNTPADPAAEDAGLARKAADFGVGVLGGVGQGAGLAVRGIGDLAAATENTLLTNPINAASQMVAGTDVLPRARNPLKTVGDAIYNWFGEASDALISDSSKQDMQNSQITGDILHPSTIDFGKDPTFNGILQQGANVLGSFLPVVAASMASGGLAGAAVGAGQAAGDQSMSSDQAIDAMAAETLPDGRTRLEAESKAYQTYLLQGMTPEAAKAATKDDAAQLAALFAAPIGALGGAIEGKLFNPIEKVMERSGVAKQVVGRGILGAASEGPQEAAEVVAGRVGANIGGGTNRDLTENTAGDFILGALGGGVAGAGAGLASQKYGKESAGSELPPGDAEIPSDIPFNDQPRGPLSHALAAAPRPAALIEGRSENAPPHGRPFAPFGKRDNVPFETPQQAARAGLNRLGHNGFKIAAVDGGYIVAPPDVSSQQQPGEANAPNPDALPVDVPADRPAASAPVGADAPATGAAGTSEINLGSTGGPSSQVGPGSGAVSNGQTGLDVPPDSGKIKGVKNEGQKAPTNLPDDAAGNGAANPAGNGTDQPGAGVSNPGMGQKPATQDNSEIGPAGGGAIQGGASTGNAENPDLPLTGQARPEGGQTDDDPHAGHKAAVGDIARGDYAKLATRDPKYRLSAISYHLDYRKGFDKAAPKLLTSAGFKRPKDSEIEAYLKGATIQKTQQGEDLGFPASDNPAMRAWAKVHAAQKGWNPFKGRFREPSQSFKDWLAAPTTPPADQAPVNQEQTEENPLDTSFFDGPDPAAPTSKPNESQERPDKEPSDNSTAEADLKALVDAAAAQAEKNPTEGQKEAGNYKKGHHVWNGLDLSFENEKGSERSGVDPEGTPWKVTLPAHYGDIKGTEGADEDKIDFYMGDNPESDVVLVVDQVDPVTKEFDEHKIILGAKNGAAARRIYLAGFSDGSGEKRIGGAQKITVAQLKEWIASGKTKAPFTEQMKAAAAKKAAKDEPGEKPSKRVKISDFGDKIAGMRKDSAKMKLATFLGGAINLKGMPLAQAFPEPNYEKLAEEGVSGDAIAAVALIRGIIPRRPNNSWQQSRWEEKVETARNYAAAILNGDQSPAMALSEVSDSDDATKAKNLWGVIRHLDWVDQIVWAAKNLDLDHAAHYDLPLDKGKYTKVFYLQNKGKWHSPSHLHLKENEYFRELDSDAIAALVDLVRQKAEAALAAKKAEDDAKEKGTRKEAEITFTIMKQKYGRESAIYVDQPRRVRLTDWFPSGSDARAYLEGNKESLTALARAMMKGPQERRQVNRERTGTDWRKGKDATEAMFKDELGFRAVAFGESQTIAERHNSMNATYDAMMDLAGLLNVPAKTLSLNGRLAIGFGTHGKGGRGHWAAAFFQSPNPAADQVIALTRENGPGTLAHEWFHSIDNFFAREDAANGGIPATMTAKEAQNRTDFMTDRFYSRTKGALAEAAVEAFRALNLSLRNSEWKKRMDRYDSFLKTPYWGTTIELAARGFERMVVDELDKRGMVSDFLVNINEAGGAYPSSAEFRASGIGKAYDGALAAMKVVLDVEGKNGPKLPPIDESKVNRKPAVGDTWASAFGTRTITAYDPSKEMFTIATENEAQGDMRRDAEQIADLKEEDAFSLTPAGQAEQMTKDAIKAAKKKAEENQAKAKAKKAEGADEEKALRARAKAALAEFIAKRGQKPGGVIDERLGKVFRWPDYEGGVQSRAVHLARLIERPGSRVGTNTKGDLVIFIGGHGSYITDNAYTRVGMEFAQFYEQWVQRDQAAKAKAEIENETLREILGFRIDNPGGEWLGEKRKAANSNMSDPKYAGTATGKGFTGATTGYFTKTLYINTSALAELPGANGERPAPGQPKYDSLMSAVKKNGFKADQDKNAVLIGINHLGQPYILEGNNRVAIANAIGVSKVRAEVRYWNGGEAVSGRMAPAAMLKIASLDAPEDFHIPDKDKTVDLNDAQDLLDDIFGDKEGDEAQAPTASSDAAKITEKFAADFREGRRFRTITAARETAGEAMGRKVEVADYLMIEEAIELAVMKVAREIVARDLAQAEPDAEATFLELVGLYTAQPILGERTPDKTIYQAYSTPAPLAYIASRLAGVGPQTRVVEPTAGNGMLLIEANPALVQANELQASRAAQLRDGLGPDAQITNANAIGMTFKPFDVLLANPPFGKLTDQETQARVEFPIGVTTTKEIDHAIAWSTLAQMPDDGRAVLIVGGIKKQLVGPDREKAYGALAKKVFYKQLYDTYNVVDHFTVAGELYSRQGAAWPVDVIVIDGRAQSGLDYPFAQAPKVLSSWTEIGRKLSDAPDVDTTGRGPELSDGGDSSEPVGKPDVSPDVSGTSGKPSGATAGGGRGGRGGGRGGNGGGRGGNGGNGRPPVAGDDAGSGSGGDNAGGSNGGGVEPGSGDQLAGPGNGVQPEPGSTGNGAGNGTGGLSGQALSVKPLDANSSGADFANAILAALGKAANPNKTNAGFAFLEDVYTNLKPIFKAAIQKLSLRLGQRFADARSALRAILEFFAGPEVGMSKDMIKEQIAPYGIQYANDVAAGKIDPYAEDDAPKDQTPEQSRSGQTETEFDLPYEPRSKSGFVVGTLVPRAMRDAMKNALDKIEAEHGDIDEYVAKELGYTVDQVIGKDGEDGYFSAEQVDALAMAIKNVSENKGFIIGDQTGIGKGRFVAAMIRYALKSGRIPTFVTQKTALYADMIRDLRDIGMADIQPAVIATNSGLGDIPINSDADAFKGATASELKDLFGALKGQKLPKGKKVIFTTYDQMRPQGEITDSGGRKIKKWPDRAHAMTAAAPRLMLILDESHTAGGQATASSWTDRKEGDPPNSTAEYFRDLVGLSAGSVFSSATYAKNPRVMSLYSSTDLRLAVDKMSDLGPAIAKGGVPLQQIVASQLTAQGQYARRQKSMVGREPNAVEMVTNLDHAIHVSKAISAMAEFDRTIAEPMRERIQGQMSALGMFAVKDSAVGIQSASSAPFTSTVHNLAAQFLLSVKLEAAANHAIDSWKAGRKPVLSLMNVNSSIIDEFLSANSFGAGNKVEIPFSAIMARYVERLRRITVNTVDGETHRFEIPDTMMSRAELSAFASMHSMIEGLPLEGLSGTPVDTLKNKMRASGMKVDEITGRGITIDDGTVGSRDSSGPENKRRMNAYNSGKLDALIISASGSTGFSLHATQKRGNDGKRRHLIVLQPNLDVNVFMQTLGRVDRTGQSSLPIIDIAFSDLAFEKRVAGVLLKKLASLTANTTAAKRSAVTIEGVDFVNEVGDEVVLQYLRSDPDLAAFLDIDLPNAGAAAPEGIAAKLTGRFIYLPPDEVADHYAAIESAYLEEIARLDAEGLNPLEAKTLDLRARVLTEAILEKSKGTGSALDQDLIVQTVSAHVAANPYSTKEVRDLVEAELAGRSNREWLEQAQKTLRDLMPAHLKNLEAVKDDRARAVEEAKSDLSEAKTDLELAKKEHAAAQADESMSIDDKKAATAKLRAQEAGLRAAESRLGKANEGLTSIENRINNEQTSLSNAITSLSGVIPGKGFILTKADGTQVSAVVIKTDLSKIGSNPTAISRIKVKFAIADATRQMDFALSQIANQSAKTQFEAFYADNLFMDAFDLAQGAGRTQERTIVSGNLIKGINRFNAKGQVAFYTTEKGEIKAGIIMPANFDLDKALDENDVVFNTPEEVQQFLTENQMAKVDDGAGILSITYASQGWGRSPLFGFSIAKRNGKPFFELASVQRWLINPRESKGKYVFSVMADNIVNVLNGYTRALGTKWVTSTYKDEARDITGEEKPVMAKPVSSPDAKQRRASGPDRSASIRDFRKVMAECLAELKRSGLIGTILTEFRPMFTFDGAPIEGYFINRTIGVALNGQENPLGVMRHEIIHALRSAKLWGRDYGVFSQGEWRAMVSEARKDKSVMAWVKANYPNATEAEQMEEAVAEAYRKWGDKRDAASLAGVAFAKMRGVLTAIINALKGNGFNSAASIFERVRDGSLAPPGGGGSPLNGDAKFRRGATNPAPVTQSQESGLLRQAMTQAMSGDLSLLGMVPGRPLFMELGRKLISARSYLRFKEEMDALRDTWHARTDKLAQHWLKMLTKNGAANARMMDLMHETTLEAVDPTKPFRRHASRRDLDNVGTLRPTNPSYIASQARLDADRRRYNAYLRAQKAFASLPVAFQDLYREVRDTYADLADSYEQTILDNIEKATTMTLRQAERKHADELRRIDDEGLLGGERVMALARADARLDEARRRAATAGKSRSMSMRAMFESNRIDGPYFPLTRFGEFFATVRDRDGKIIEFRTYENVSKRDRYAKEQKAIAGQSVETGVLQGAELRKAVDPAFVAQVEELLRDSGADEAVMDSIWQHWLMTLPDLSVRRNRIHRKGTPGFNPDAFRAFARHMFHGSHQLARLTYSMDMEDALEEARREAQRSDDPTRQGLIVKEMALRHKYTMNPQGAWWSQKLTSAAFIYYLAMTPAAAIVNLSQTTIIGIPVLSTLNKGSGGLRQATAQINRALLDFTRGRGHAVNSGRLTDLEKAAMAEAYRRGTIDKTQGHDLAGIADTGAGYSAIQHKIMSVISWGFHNTEKLNREVTFLAAYRMAKLNGSDHSAAIEKAADLTWRTHFDYQNNSRPRFMQGNTARVFLAMKNFQVNALWRIFRDVHQTFKGETPEIQREARKQLFAVTGMMALHAGIRGTWITGIALMILGLLTGRDKDDLEEEFKGAVVETLGTQIGGALWYGLPGYATGTSLSDRIGMPDLWFRSPDRALEGEDEFNYWAQQFLGPVAGIPLAMFRGKEQMEKGNFERGLEGFMPKSVRDLMKSYRYATEGATTTNGDPLVDEVPTLDVLKQALGFTPAEIAERFEVNSRLYNVQSQILDQRQSILRSAAQAAMQGQSPDAATMARIEAFNAANPDYPITGDSINRSAQARMRAHERAEFGATLNPKLNDRLRAERAPMVFN